LTAIQVYDFANAQLIRGPGGHPMQVPKPSMTAVERAALEHEKRKALFRDRLGPQPADLYADMAEERGPRPYHLSTFNAPLGSPLPSIAEVCAEQDRISRSLSERSRSHSGLAAEALEMERQHFLERTGPIPRTTTIVHTSHSTTTKPSRRRRRWAMRRPARGPTTSSSSAIMIRSGGRRGRPPDQPRQNAGRA
jgi:hypothetical protein